MSTHAHESTEPIFLDQPGDEAQERPFSGFGMVLNSKPPGDPRDETFLQMLHTNLCPRLTCFSFAVFAAIAFACLFIIQLVISGVKYDGEFLEVNRTYLTSALMLTRESVLSDKQLHRLLTSVLLHSSLPALVNTAILLLIWVSWIECMFGIARSLVIFFLTAFAGNAFGVLFAIPADFLMGASVGIFGLLGACLGFIIFNWRNILSPHFSKLYLFWMVTFVIVFSMLLCGSATAVMLQLGGVLAGIACGLFASPVEVVGGAQPKRYSAHQTVAMTCGMVVYACFVGIPLCIIILAH